MELGRTDDSRRHRARFDGLFGFTLVLVVGVWNLVDTDDRDVDEVRYVRFGSGIEEPLGPVNINCLRIPAGITGGMDNDIDTADRLIDPSSIGEIEFDPLYLILGWGRTTRRSEVVTGVEEPRFELPAENAGRARQEDCGHAPRKLSSVSQIGVDKRGAL